MIMVNSILAQQKHALVIHGCAGTILRENMTKDAEQAHIYALTESLNAGYAELQKGGTITAAIVAAVSVMEDSPLFDAGKGAVLPTTARTNLTPPS